MRLFKNTQNDILLYPGDREQVYFWTKKWGVTNGQLNEAILETGSIQVKDIKSYLVKKGLVFSLMNFLGQNKG